MSAAPSDMLPLARLMVYPLRLDAGAAAQHSAQVRAGLVAAGAIDWDRLLRHRRFGSCELLGRRRLLRL